MDILTFINYLTNEDLNRIRNSKSDAEARRLLREHQALQLQQNSVSTCFLEDYQDHFFEVKYALLISKAPEMLEMLEKLIVTFSGEDLELYQVTRLKEAERLIKKATTI